MRCSVNSLVSPGRLGIGFGIPEYTLRVGEERAAW